jgi:hypothetical protein
MKTTPHQVELQSLIARACLNSAAEVAKAITSANEVTSGIDQYLETVEDPDERLSWVTTKQTWVRLSADLTTWWTILQEIT